MARAGKWPLLTLGWSEAAALLGSDALSSFKVAAEGALKFSDPHTVNLNNIPLSPLGPKPLKPSSPKPATRAGRYRAAFFFAVGNTPAHSDGALKNYQPKPEPLSPKPYKGLGV